MICLAAVAKGTLAKIEDDLFEILHGASCPHFRFSARKGSWLPLGLIGSPSSGLYPSLSSFLFPGAISTNSCLRSLLKVMKLPARNYSETTANTSG